MRSRLLLLSLAAALVSTILITVAVAAQWWTLAAAVGALLVGATLVLAADANRQARTVRRRLTKLSHRLDQAAKASRGPGEGALGHGRVEGVRAVETPEMNLPTTQFPGEANRADMLGAVRVLQAQYTARLDRLQATVEEALADLRDQKDLGADTHAPR